MRNIYEMFYRRILMFLSLLLLVSSNNKSAAAQLQADTDGFFSNCKMLFTFGYSYTQLYQLPKSAFKEEGVYMEFYVRARSDAHVLLSPSSTLDDGEPVYEIVLGAGKNSFTDIRRLRRAGTKATAPTPDLLSAVELRGFWISIRNGVIEVGKMGDSTPFIFWSDYNPLPVKFFGFSTWTDVFGKWFYDCRSTPNDTSTAVEKSLTMTDRLRKDLLQDYDPEVIPKSNYDERLPITVRLQSWHIELDAKTSVITLNGIFGMGWIDEKMKWEPSKYGGIKSIQLVHGEIWRPEFVLYNAAGHGADPLGASGFVVTAVGSVLYAPKTKLQARCKINLEDWPFDEHTCKLELGFWASQDFLQLVLLENGTQLRTQITTSEWKVNKLEAETTWMETPFYDAESASEVPTHTALVVKVSVRRSSSLYGYLFLVPLFVATLIGLIGIGLAPVGTVRVGIQCFCLFCCALFIIALDRALPASVEKTPSLVQAYCKVMATLTVTTVSSAWVNSISRGPYLRTPPNFLVKLLRAGFLQGILGLPEPNSDGLHKYDTLNEEEEEDRNGVAVYWAVFGTAVDRVISLIASIYLATVLLFN